MMKNVSERLFEEYLGTHGYGDWEFEPTLPGKRKKPDYLIHWNGAQYFCEVKERSAIKDWEPSKKPRHIDPSAGIRQEIQEARQKFKEFKEFPCCLVLYNNGDHDTWLRPEHVFASMLGRLTLTMEFDGNRAYHETARTVFGRGGTMVRDRTGEYQNTTISAVIVIEKADLERVVSTSPPLSKHRVLRVVVHENPGARFPLPRDLFSGPYDERWGYLEGADMEGHGLTQVAVGVRVCEILDLNETKEDDISDDDEYI